MNTQESELAQFIAFLNEHDCLKHVVIVGSWAEYLYEKTGLLPGYYANIKTLDIDFLVRNLRVPAKAMSLSSEARKSGYAVMNDRLTGATKILSPKGVEIEFLIAKVGAGLEETLKTNLGVTAQSLRHLELLKRHIVAIEFQGMLVNVPTPEAYALHKMVINHERGLKSDKDAQAIRNIWPYLNMEELREMSSSLSKKELARVNAFMTGHGLTLQ